MNIFADVCGNISLPSLKLAAITSQMMFLFLKFKSKLREARHSVWIDIYENPAPQWRQQKRVALVVTAMTNEDDSFLKILAEVFEESRIGVLAHIFWDDLQHDDAGTKPWYWVNIHSSLRRM